jgi:trans-aconitate methyltransferase
MNDSWLGGIAYEKFMGRWSALVARQFLSWLAGNQARTCLDVGCGTGSLTQCILDEYRTRQFISVLGWPSAFPCVPIQWMPSFPVWS